MNKNPNAIHETVIKDLMDLWDTIRTTASNVDNNGTIFSNKKNAMNVSSIAKASSNLTMVFPVLCSRGISIEVSSMISRAIEKRYVTMLQMLFASWQVTNPDANINNVQDYISQFHNNITTQGATLDDLFTMATMGESVQIPSELVEAVRQDNIRNTDFYLPSNINETALTDYKVSNGIVTEADDVKRDDATKFYKDQVRDAEYKKANELVPTMMVVNFTLRKKQSDGTYKDTDVSDAIVGVKAKLYPISSDEITSNIADKTQSRNWITNFIRATTREISFLKDFVLAIDKAKIDAMSMSQRNSSKNRMWKVLERRATSSRIKRALRQNNNAAAITTLVISQDEVEYLRKNHNIDMEKLSTVVGLFESLNLLGFVIVDEALEVAKFIFDEQDPSWETVSFTHLERESNDNTYKRVVNLITKVAN